MPQFLKQFALAKADETTHTVYGVATAEEPDKDGEICDYEAAKKAYATWSAEASASTKAAGQDISYGNIRWMHQVDIAGKASTPPEFDDEKKQICLKTTPIPDKWELIKAGFVRSFSQGGDYAWRKCNECRTDIEKGNACPKCKKAVYIRYAPIIAEVSYVDNPCVKAATFTLVKADGTEELKKFTEGSSPVEPTSAGTPAANIDIEAITAQVTKSILAKLGKTKKYLVTDGDDQHLPYTDDDGSPNHRLMGAAWAALHGGYRGNKYQGPDKEKAIERLKAVYTKEGLDTPDEKAKKAVTTVLEKSAAKQGLEKGLYDVSRFAELMQSLQWLYESSLYERDYEGDESPVPEELLSHLESLADVFVAMAQEEIKELTAIAGGKGHTKMSNTSALQKAHKSLSEHIQQAKEAVSAHCDKMCKAHEAHRDALHEHLDKCLKVMGAEEADKDESSKPGAHEPAAIDPQKEGTPGSMKSAEGAFTKADLEKAVADATDAAVAAVLKALSSDDETQEGDGKKAEKAAPAAGIGDRTQAPVVAVNAGPVVKVMPVTKTQDSQPTTAVAEEPLTPAELQKALAGDPAMAAKFMKGVRVEGSVPATVAAPLSAVRR